MKVFLTFALISLFAVVHSAFINRYDISERSPIDPIIRKALESMRPKFANLTIQDINEKIQDPHFNVSIVVKDILIENLDKFEIRNIKSKVVPITLTNLTLVWKQVQAKALYDVNGRLRIPNSKTPIKFYGKGKAGVELKNLFFTIGANIEMKDKIIQIKQRGLFGFDIRIGSANVTLGEIMGQKELGKIFGNFLSNTIPTFVDEVKKPLFEALQDDIIKVINEILKKGFSYVQNEEEIDLSELEGVSLDNLEQQLSFLDESYESEEDAREGIF